MKVVEKGSWGGKRREGVTKESIAVTIDIVNLDWIEENGKGKNRSDKINNILTAHRERIEQILRDAEGEGEVL